MRDPDPDPPKQIPAVAAVIPSRATSRLTPPQRAIREFLKVRTSYDVLPLSFRLIVLDTTLLIKKSLNILIQNSEHTGLLAPS